MTLPFINQVKEFFSGSTATAAPDDPLEEAVEMTALAVAELERDPRSNPETRELRVQDQTERRTLLFTEHADTGRDIQEDLVKIDLEETRDAQYLTRLNAARSANRDAVAALHASRNEVFSQGQANERQSRLARVDDGFTEIRALFESLCLRLGTQSLDIAAIRKEWPWATSWPRVQRWDSLAFDLANGLHKAGFRIVTATGASAQVLKAGACLRADDVRAREPGVTAQPAPLGCFRGA